LSSARVLASSDDICRRDEGRESIIATTIYRLS
jgi:hypothetical protein